MIKFFIHSTVYCVLLGWGTIVRADYKDDIAHTALVSELGLSVADGSGVLVTHAEAASSFINHDDNPSTPALPVYLPNPSDSRFLGKTITDKSSLESGTYSNHAIGVGSLFYGNTSIAPAINSIDAYWADDWLQAGFLRLGGNKPLSSSSRVANHSWVGSLGNNSTMSDLLRRIDWVVETDDYIQIVGTNNGIGTNSILLSAAYNVIAVGKTDGNHSTGSVSVDATYPSGRTRTEIVAPFTHTSSSTPAVAATAALLVDTGHSNPGLSTDSVVTSTLNRNGDVIYNAERSEVIRAALLAGADRFTRNTSTSANISDYRVAMSNQTNNGLDSRFGAGQINVFNSYHIIAASEQNSSEDGGAGSSGIGVYGFDYDPSFGGANGSNTTGSYSFATGSNPVILTASLVWNIDIAGGNGINFSGTATLRDLDLFLYDMTGGQTLVTGSTSLIDNSENIWMLLGANRNYRLQVVPKSGQNNFEWDYALAWQIASDLDGDGVPDTTDAFPLDATETTDTDGDGIGNNADTDDDGDGLSDSTELTLGTNPLLVDTDGDGFTDFEEVLAGSNPLDINSIPATANGDINNDGSVDVRDVLIGLRVLVNLATLTADQLARADVAPLVNNTPSPDGVFNLGDYIVIQRKALGIINF